MIVLKTLPAALMHPWIVEVRGVAPVVLATGHCDTRGLRKRAQGYKPDGMLVNGWTIPVENHTSVGYFTFHLRAAL